jgi:predicted DNA-binding protein (UPF0251 family)
MERCETGTQAMTPKQEDREAAEQLWRIHPRELQDMGLTRAEYYAQALASARMEGARMALEAAAKVAESKMQFDRWGNRAWWYGDGNSACIGIATAIRQIDPAALKGAE